MSTKPTIKKNKIIDIDDLSNQGIIFKDHNALQEIYEQSGPLADSCEFQVHYWALVFRHVAQDNSILDIAIPVVYFNYKQEVSAGRIDFDMAEVKELSTKLAPVAQLEAKKILDTDFLNVLQARFNAVFTPILTELNTIHKHPGGSRSQAFSGTDLDTNPTDHGVVYPLASANNNVPNFAGIMALDSRVNNTAHFEYRLVNGTINKDITYKRGRCLAITIKPIKQLSAVEELLKYPAPASSAIKHTNSSIIAEDDFFTGVLEEMYRSINYKPFTKAVVPSNVTRKPIVSTSKYNGWGGTYTLPLDLKDEIIPALPKMLEEAELKTMLKKDLIKYLTELDTYYYTTAGDLEDYNEYKKSDLIDEILDIQIAIIAEQPMERDDLIAALTKAGFAKTTLATKSRSELQALYDFQG